MCHSKGWVARAAEAESLPRGKYVLHIETMGMPHCFGLEILRAETGPACARIHDGEKRTELSARELAVALAEGVDGAVAVIFHVSQKLAASEPGGRLLALRAGAGVLGDASPTGSLREPLSQDGWKSRVVKRRRATQAS